MTKHKKRKKKQQIEEEIPGSGCKGCKKIVAASLEADKAEVAAVDQQLDAALKRRAAGSAVVSATSVVDDVNDEVAAEKKFNEQQKKIKLASVKSRLSKMSKKVTLKVD